MATTPSKDTAGQDLASEARRVIQTAYAAVKGREAREGFLSFSFEEALDQQIELIEGKPRNGRSNELDRIAKTEQDFLSMVEKIKKLPPEYFDQHDDEKDVNTSP